MQVDEGKGEEAVMMECEPIEVDQEDKCEGECENTEVDKDAMLWMYYVVDDHGFWMRGMYIKDDKARREEVKQNSSKVEYDLASNRLIILQCQRSRDSGAITTFSIP